MSPSLRNLSLLLLLAGAAVLGYAVGRRGRAGSEPQGPRAASSETRTAVVAMARLEPESLVVRVAASQPDLVERVLVKEGAAVEPGTLLAVLSSYRLRELEADAAQLRLERARLKPLDVEAQAAQARQAEADAAYYRAEAERQKGLLARGLLSELEYNATALQATRTAEERKRAQAVLEQARRVAALSLREAENDLEAARARVTATEVRAPLAGRVLKVLVRAGERPAGALFELGDTQRMQAVAEVHATDIRLVRPGQRAVFTSASLPGPLQGVVASVGAMVGTGGVLGEDPGAATNTRVFQVRIRLDRNEAASGFSNLEGQVRIQLGEAPGVPEPIGG